MTGTKLAVTIGAAALLLAACSSSSTSGTTGTTTATHSAAAQAPAAPASSAPAAATSALDGTWHGQYGGSYQGTFILHWRQSASKLNGHIHLSNPSSSLPIHGSVSGGSIQFGTVGSYAITYSGRVSGGSMSGTYHVANGSGGNWSASKG
jgi:ABC-type phosphate transport system substrate-binding protein